MDVVELLKRAVREKASDIHLTVGTPAAFRISGDLALLGSEDGEAKSLSREDTGEATKILMTPEQYEIWQKKGELEFSYSLPGVGRFRVNAYRQRGCSSLAIRPVPYNIPELESLGLPAAVSSFAGKKQGLILVSGPTGSGKSTTLAALIDKINQERSCHIITIENPIEYLHQHKKSIVNQREIGSDTFSTAGALRSCLRQDPDVILIGEMSDAQTIATAIDAAEMGHLVFAALSVNGVVQTVERIIEIFPPEQHEQIKVQLAATLQGVVAQQLVPGIVEKNRVLAAEVMSATPAVRNLIREGKTHQIPTVLQTGERWGMQTMDMALERLVQNGQITRETALKYSLKRKI